MSGELFKFLIAIAILSSAANCQEFTSNTLGDFVKGLTNLIGQNGGLGSLVNALPRPPAGYAPAYYYDGVQDPYRPAPPPSYPPPALPPGLYPNEPYYPQQQQQQPFLSALDSIARNDERRCVPRLLCEVTSGGKPGYPSYGQQTTRDTITTLLATLNLGDNNPLVIFGRAALLGAASRGNSAACLSAYPNCPQDPDRLVYYLNNHNGGFFRFFGGLPGQQRDPGTGPEEDGEARIQNRPFTSGNRYASKQPDSLSFPHSDYLRPTAAQDYVRPVAAQDYLRPAAAQDYFRPVAAQDYLPLSAHGRDRDRLVFPTDSGHRGGKQFTFAEEQTGFYKPNYSPPQNLINFRDQRSVKFPSSRGKMSFPKDDGLK